MITHPELGFFDEGIGLANPQLYARSTEPFGRAQVLIPTAYRSKVFANLEDEKIWTRTWVCIGSEQEIPDPGDLLPYTVGSHGIHVQRELDSSLVGRFNKAQHGGCRSVPAQCQTGRKTKCSFTSCGYSRDRNVIKADELGENTPAMRQYLGFNPERLLPVKVETWGPLIFVNLDHEAAALADQLQDLPCLAGSPFTPDFCDFTGFWAEYSCNWKLAGSILMEHAVAEVKGVGTPSELIPADSSVRVRRPWHTTFKAAPTRLEGEFGTAAPRQQLGGLVAADGTDVPLFWVFPNLLLALMPTHAVSIVLQPTATMATLLRLRIFFGGTVADTKLLATAGEKIKARWQAALQVAGRRAEALQQELSEWATPSRPDTTLEDLPLENNYWSYCFQRFLVECILTEYEH